MQKSSQSWIGSTSCLAKLGLQNLSAGACNVILSALRPADKVALMRCPQLRQWVAQAPVSRLHSRVINYGLEKLTAQCAATQHSHLPRNLPPPSLQLRDNPNSECCNALHHNQGSLDAPNRHRQPSTENIGSTVQSVPDVTLHTTMQMIARFARHHATGLHLVQTGTLINQPVAKGPCRHAHDQPVAKQRATGLHHVQTSNSQTNWSQASSYRAASTMKHDASPHSQACLLNLQFSHDAPGTTNRSKAVHNMCTKSRAPLPQHPRNISLVHLSQAECLSDKLHALEALAMHGITTQNHTMLRDLPPVCNLGNNPNPESCNAQHYNQGFLDVPKQTMTTQHGQICLTLPSA